MPSERMCRRLRLSSASGSALLPSMQNAEHYVRRWRDAGLIDEGTAAAILTYEQAQAKPRGRQWQVMVALILGGILLGAGVLLFVAAHWDKVSPQSRMLLVLSMLVF